MIRTYLRIQLSSEGESPKKVIERMRSLGGVPIIGDFDFEFSLEEDERLFEKLEEIHRALMGAGVRYTVSTLTDTEVAGRGRLIARYVDQKPVELRKSLYKAKLERWKEMGLDVSELEALLETDIDRFKEVSRDFLKTHLDHMSVVRDRKSDDNLVDGQVLALLDETGKPLSEIISITGFSEDQILLSLGRLISSGSALRVQKGATEVYCLIPPPAPVVRKALVLVPAGDSAEAERRVLEAIQTDGSSGKDVVRTSRLPRDQFNRAVESLQRQGRIKIVKRSNKELYVRV